MSPHGAVGGEGDGGGVDEGEGEGEAEGGGDGASDGGAGEGEGAGWRISVWYVTTPYPGALIATIVAVPPCSVIEVASVASLPSQSPAPVRVPVVV